MSSYPLEEVPSPKKKCKRSGPYVSFMSSTMLFPVMCVPTPKSLNQVVVGGEDCQKEYPFSIEAPGGPLANSPLYWLPVQSSRLSKDSTWSKCAASVDCQSASANFGTARTAINRRSVLRILFCKTRNHTLLSEICGSQENLRHKFHRRRSSDL